MSIPPSLSLSPSPSLSLSLSLSLSFRLSLSLFLGGAVQSYSDVCKTQTPLAQSSIMEHFSVFILYDMKDVYLPRMSAALMAPAGWDLAALRACSR